ncbi:MAG TPA: hypothetical protein VFD92_04485 [Candidatus Binatia bacterium]|nr:hypothetical protein [Candidatus Binatia bacterium]
MRIRFLTIAALLAAASPAGAQSHGMQGTPDRKQILVNKDVGDQRWAIALDGDRGTVSGNVFFPDGSPPAFVWCRVVDSDHNDDPRLTVFYFDCQGADRCAATPCGGDQWTPIASRVPISGAFFLP